MSEQLAFLPAPPTTAQLRIEAWYGEMDARCHFGIRNLYSAGLTGERLAAYERGYREACERWRREQARA